MKNYQVTIGYRAVFQVDVKAEDEISAKAKAIEKFDKTQRSKLGKRNDIVVMDDRYAADGIVNFSESWYKLYE